MLGLAALRAESLPGVGAVVPATGQASKQVDTDWVEIELMLQVFLFGEGRVGAHTGTRFCVGTQCQTRRGPRHVLNSPSDWTAKLLCSGSHGTTEPRALWDWVCKRREA